MQDCGYTLRTIAVDSEDRAGDGYALQGTGHVPDKLRMSSGRGKDAQSVLPKALRYHRDPVQDTRKKLKAIDCRLVVWSIVRRTPDGHVEYQE